MSVERHNQGNLKFINLIIGDKVLLRSIFKTSNLFAKPTWERVVKTIPTSDGAVRTVTVKKANGERVTLTTSKLAIAEEDLVERYSEVPRPRNHRPPSYRQHRHYRR